MQTVVERPLSKRNMVCRKRPQRIALQASSNHMFFVALEHQSDLVVLQHETLVEPSYKEVYGTHGMVQDQCTWNLTPARAAANPVRVRGQRKLGLVRKSLDWACRHLGNPELAIKKQKHS